MWRGDRWSNSRLTFPLHVPEQSWGDNEPPTLLSFFGSQRALRSMDKGGRALIRLFCLFSHLRKIQSPCNSLRSPSDLCLYEGKTPLLFVVASKMLPSMTGCIEFESVCSSSLFKVRDLSKKTQQNYTRIQIGRPESCSDTTCCTN